MKISLAERVFNIIALLLFSGAGITILEAATGFDPRENLEGGSKITQTILLVVYFVSIVFLSKLGLKRITKFVLKDKILIALLFFVFISAFWSDFPSISLRRSIAVILTSIYGIYFGFKFTFKQQLEYLKAALALAILLSSFFCLAYSSNPLFVHTTGVHGGAWMGLFAQKNVLGRYAVISSVLFLVSLLRSQKSIKDVFVDVFMLSFSVYVLFMSTSKTSLVVLAAIIFVIFILRRLQKFPSNVSLLLLVLGILVSGIFAVLLVYNLETFTVVLGRDTTLSGRTDLWVFIIEKINQRPLIGYGYSGFWLGDLGESYDVSMNFSWLPNHSHNGFLDVALDIGWAGLLLFLISFSICSFRALVYLSYNKSYIAIWPLAFVAMSILFNVTYSVFLNQNDLLWVVYTAVSFRLVSELDLQRTRRYGDFPTN